MSDLRATVVRVALICSVIVTHGASADTFETSIRPLLAKYCFKCHGTGDEIAGDVDLVKVKTPEQIEAQFELWERVVERLNDQSMPPEDELQPTTREQQAIRNWYQERFVRSVKPHPGDFRPRRLSAHEYRNTLESLLGFPLEVAIVEAEQTIAETSLVMKLLPTDPPGPSGFTNDTSGNPLTTLIWDQYSYLADNGLAKLFSKRHRAALEAYAGPIEDDHLSAEQARTLLKRFRRRAYRRPGPAIDSGLFEGLYGQLLNAAVRTELKTVLMSPPFLYRGLLLDIPMDSEQPVDDFELAERLSYFLWADMPDEELFQLAEHGELHDPDVYRAQIDRMLASPKARNLATDFGSQWFLLSEIESVSNNPPVAAALHSQPIDFLAYLFTEKRPLTELIDSETEFINPHTATYYPGDRKQLTKYRKQKGIEVEIVPNQQITLVKNEERGGLLTMPGVLAMNKGPIQRGTWILERVLGTKLPEPPPDVGQVKPNVAGEELTFRQRFEAHRRNATCAVCHDRIDPLGFALQRFDDNGRFVVAGTKSTGKKGNGSTNDKNNHESDSLVDTSGRLPSGETFDNFAGLKEILVTSRREDVTRNIVRQTLAFALARKLEYSDRPTVDAIVHELHSDNGTFHDLIHAVAHSLPFQKTFVRSR